MYAKILYWFPCIPKYCAYQLVFQETTYKGNMYFWQRSYGHEDKVQYKLHRMGISIDGTSHIYGDSMSIINYTS